MAIPVKLPVFEGPLDLLLHLIDKNKIDIYDIPIVEITDQYLEYIHQMEREDLDIMSEFMVMAATLLDIKCRMADIRPSAVVVVATVRALKHHGGVSKADLGTENLSALEKGLPNLLQHVENITKGFGLPAVVAINRFPTDTEAELKLVEDKCRQLGVNVALSEVWGKGGAGGLELAEEVLRLID